MKINMRSCIGTCLLMIVMLVGIIPTTAFATEGDFSIQNKSNFTITPADITVSFTLLGDKVHTSNVDGEVHTNYDNNLTTWIDTTSYTVSSTATVKDVLEVALSANHMTCKNTSGNYVQSITKDGVTLGEFTNGLFSGWMYTLNGEHPSNGVAQQTLTSGDVIVFHYTDMYPRESGNTAQQKQSLKASISKDSIAIGESTTITATGVGTFTYTSSDETVATVDSKGVVVGKKIGTATITVNASGNTYYKSAEKTVDVTIKADNKVTISNASITCKAKTSAQTVTIKATKTGGDFTYTSSDTKVTVDEKTGKVTIPANYVGKVTITVKAENSNYQTATAKATITVSAISDTLTVKNITKDAKITTQTYSFKVTRKSSGKLSYSSDNTAVTVKNRKVVIAKNFVGKATITVKEAASGIYKATTTTFTVTTTLKGTKLSSVTNTKGQKMTVKWSKNANVAGYQIQYSTDKKFKKSVKTVSVSKASTTSKTISGLKKGSKYYVRIRTKMGTKHSDWSASKSVTINK